MSQGRGAEIATSNIHAARIKLSEMTKSEQLMRDETKIWGIYSDVEFGIALAKFAFGVANMTTGRFREISKSIKNDPSTMTLELLKAKLASIDSELEYAEYCFESSIPEKGIESARKARDELKLLLLGGRKSKRIVRKES